jgi:hypothetical protein
LDKIIEKRIKADIARQKNITSNAWDVQTIKKDPLSFLIRDFLYFKFL